MEELKQLLLSVMAALDDLKAEASVIVSNVDELKDIVDEALRMACYEDLASDADRLIAAKESKVELDKQQRRLGSRYDF